MSLGRQPGGHVILVCDSGCGQADGWRQLAGFVAAAVSVCMQDRWRISWAATVGVQRSEAEAAGSLGSRVAGQSAGRLLLFC